MENLTQAVHLDQIAQVALTVTNLAEAKAFYQDVLGMQFLFEAGTMAFFQCGGVRLMIGASESASASASASESDKPFNPEGAVVYFRIAEIESACAALKSRGVVFLQEPHLVARMKSHDLWLAFLKDPAGNPLGLMSEVAREAAPAA
jgi:methylmalonyl-CoA/ethylmalonyl-CoA epimerase